MKSSMQKIVIFAVSALLATGCATRIGDFTLVSSKNVDLTHGADFKRSAVRVKAEDTVTLILGVPIGLPNMKTALDHAIEKTPGAVALVDGVITQKRYDFIIFGQLGYEVEGTPLIDPLLEKSYR
jgi:hypothetical protein